MTPEARTAEAVARILIAGGRRFIRAAQTPIVKGIRAGNG